MPRAYQRRYRGRSNVEMTPRHWLIFVFLCIIASVITYGISIVVLVFVAIVQIKRSASRSIRKANTNIVEAIDNHDLLKYSKPEPPALNAEIIEEDLRNDREKRKSDIEIREKFDDSSWNPLGLAKEEWMALPVKERIAAYKKFHGQPKEPYGTVKYGPRGGVIPTKQQKMGVHTAAISDFSRYRSHLNFGSVLTFLCNGKLRETKQKSVDFQQGKYFLLGSAQDV